VLLALHGTKPHHAAHVGATAIAGDRGPSTLLQAAIVVAPFRELAGMPRPLTDADDDADDRTTHPESPPTRQALPVAGRSSADPAPAKSFAIAALATPEPVSIAHPLPKPTAGAPAIPASPRADAQRTVNDSRATSPPPEAAKPVNAGAIATAKAAPQQQDRITIFQFSSAAFFTSAAATLSDSGRTILENLLDRMQSPAFAAYRITVEGHTDDEPISNSQFPSNWELSAARAAAVVRFFVEHKIPADRLRATGYADTHPLAPNRDAAGSPIPGNQAENRRVVIELEKIDHGGT
jgi:outer membrane protein OmpA-like peptidoglycan-associated protein